MQRIWIQSQLYRRIIHKLFGIPKNASKLSIPCEIIGDFKVHYLSYDKDGNVHGGFRTLRQALKNRQNYGITVLYE